MRSIRADPALPEGRWMPLSGSSTRAMARSSSAAARLPSRWSSESDTSLPNPTLLLDEGRWGEGRGAWCWWCRHGWRRGQELRRCARRSDWGKGHARAYPGALLSSSHTRQAGQPGVARCSSTCERSVQRSPRGLARAPWRPASSGTFCTDQLGAMPTLARLAWAGLRRSPKHSARAEPDLSPPVTPPFPYLRRCLSQPLHLLTCSVLYVSAWLAQMVLLRLQKRLAAAVMKCGKRKVWLDPNEVNEISTANSRTLSVCVCLFLRECSPGTSPTLMRASWDMAWVLGFPEAARPVSCVDRFACVVEGPLHGVPGTTGTVRFAVNSSQYTERSCDILIGWRKQHPRCACSPVLVLSPYAQPLSASRTQSYPYHTVPAHPAPPPAHTHTLPRLWVLAGVGIRPASLSSVL